MGFQRVSITLHKIKGISTLIFGFVSLYYYSMFLSKERENGVCHMRLKRSSNFSAIILKLEG
jgi:hypothetical protein